LIALRFSRPARADLQAITTYIAQESPERARAFATRITERCTLLQTSPALGRLRPEFGDDVRSLSVRPTVVLYRIREDRNEVAVLRVIDGRRDLGTIFAEDV
jgi:toxin ParE1/3/4